MPKYTPTEDDMLDESYSEPQSTAAPEESVDEENAGADEILVAKTKLPDGTKEGDTCTFKVTKDFGDEMSLTPVSDYKESETESEPMSQEGQELSALAEEGE